MKKLLGVVFFLVSVIAIFNIAGSKATYYFLLLTLLGIVVVNVDKIKKL
jgi:hypothetical protein